MLAVRGSNRGGAHVPSFVEILLTMASAIFVGAVGYWFGAGKFFKEHQLIVYGANLPALMKFTFHPEGSEDEREFNEALARILLYSSKNVVEKIDTAVSYRLVPERGDFVTAMRSAIAAMRRDIQPWWRFRSKFMSEKKIEHMYLSLRPVADNPTPEARGG